MTTDPAHRVEVAIIGGGPAGAATALCLARAGVDALMIEKAEFPRFHVGESFLPENITILRRLGLLEKVRALPHVVKRGAEFGFGYDTLGTDFWFNTGLIPGDSDTLNIERAPFDALLLDEARAAGARQVTAGVRSVEHLSDGEVRLATDVGIVEARYVVDASGQNTLLARHLGIRRPIPGLNKVAYFAHLTGVRRRDGDPGGFPSVAMCDEGWFWLIPIDERRTSVGLVLDAGAARTAGVPANRMLRWGIERCPMVRDRVRDATIPETNGVIADFSYTCRPYAGPGYFLVGDSAVFIDPIFSSGVCLGLVAAVDCADRLRSILREGGDPGSHRRAFIRGIDQGSGAFFRLVRRYYRHEFRELFLHGRGPVQVERAIISILAGRVFPRPSWNLLWRLRLFELSMALQRRIAIVPRRERFSLTCSPPELLADASSMVEGRPHAAAGAVL